MEKYIGERARQIYDSMKPKLTNDQVLVPKLRPMHAPPELGEGRYGGVLKGYEVVGYKVKNIRKLDLTQIEHVIRYAPEQLLEGEAKWARLRAREDRLKERLNKRLG